MRDLRDRLLRMLRRVVSIEMHVNHGSYLVCLSFVFIDPSTCPSSLQYFGLVILMFLGEFMLGTLAFIFREHLAKSLKDELLFGIEKHYNLTREPGTLPAIWDHIHTEVDTLLEREIHNLEKVVLSFFFFTKKSVKNFSSTAAACGITRIGSESTPGRRRTACPIPVACRENGIAVASTPRGVTRSSGTRKAARQLFKCGW